MSAEINNPAELKPEDFDMDAIKDYLEQYYESAGFDDFYSRVLAPMSEERALGYFLETFSPEYNEDMSDNTEVWEGKTFSDLMDSLRKQ